MYLFPEQTAVNKVLAKTKIFEKARPSKAVRLLFTQDVVQIVWKHKLSPETLNLSSACGIQEIQVFEITLKRLDISLRVLQTIDRAIPYPVFYQLRRDDAVQVVAAYKRPAQDGTPKWVLGEYYRTEWMRDGASERRLPVSLDLRGLYEQMMHTLIALPPQNGESLVDLVEREAKVRQLRNQITRLNSKMRAEKQFNRKVNHHSDIRRLEAELSTLLMAEGEKLTSQS